MDSNIIPLGIPQSTLLLLQDISPGVTIYPEDIVRSVPSLKDLSILTLIQTLLNSRVKQDYLRLYFPFWKCLGWSS